MNDEFGPTVRKLQSNVQGLQEETETFQQAATELRQKREQLQNSLDEEDRALAERRSALTQFQFRLKSQGLLVEDCEKRAKEAEQENATIQAELSELRKCIADEKRQRLEKLDGSHGQVQTLVKQFQQAASLAEGDAASAHAAEERPGTPIESGPSPDSETESVRSRVAELRESVEQLGSQLQDEKEQHWISQDVKRTTLQDAKAAVDSLVDQLQGQHSQ